MGTGWTSPPDEHTVAHPLRHGNLLLCQFRFCLLRSMG
jgi:hypothetical protein